MLNLDAYFTRINYSGPRTPTLATVQAIHARHAAAIPFENLDPFLGRPVAVDLASVQDKLVTRQRGGYCFEQNTLFRAVLEALGIAVTSLLARVYWNAPPGAPTPPRTHMILRTVIDGQDMIADVGFGGHLLAHPYALRTDAPQQAGASTLRLVDEGPQHLLQVRGGEDWRDIYRFTLEPAVAADIELANWFTATHPESRFRKFLILQRLLSDARLVLLNRGFIRRGADGSVQSVEIADAAELARLLAEDFGVVASLSDAQVILDRLPVG